MADVVVNASESGARWHLVVLHALAKARGQVSCGVKAIIRVPADGAGSAPAGCSKASMSCMHLSRRLNLPQHLLHMATGNASVLSIRFAPLWP